MKSLLVFTAVLCFASSSFAAIEFSEDVAAADLPAEAVITADEVAAGAADASTGSATSTGSTILPLSSNSSSTAAVTSAQASGSTGTTVSASSGVRGGAVLGGGGGGGGRADDGAVETDDLVAEAAAAGAAPTPATQSGPELAAEPVSMPEPSTAVVWSILAAFGIVAVRRRMK